MDLIERRSLASLVIAQLLVVSFINLITIKRISALDKKVVVLKAEYETARRYRDKL